MDTENVMSEVMRLNKYVGECRVEWEMAKARASDCKKAYDDAVDGLTGYIEQQSVVLPLLEGVENR